MKPAGPTYKWWVVFMLWFVCFFNYADRQAIFSVAYLLGGFTAFELFSPHGIELYTLATSVFGQAVFTAAADRVFTLLTDWGYSPGTRGITRTNSRLSC